MELILPADWFNFRGEQNRIMKDAIYAFSLSSWINGDPIKSDREGLPVSRPWGKIKCSVSNTVGRQINVGNVNESWEGVSQMKV